MARRKLTQDYLNALLQGFREACGPGPTPTVRDAPRHLVTHHVILVWRD